MEIIEMPTQLTTNVPTTIGVFTEQDSFKPSNVEVTSDDQDNSNELFDSNSSKSETHEEVVEKKTMADRLFDSAKEDGFEDALEKLSQGEFDDAQVIEEEVVKTVEDDKEPKKENLDPVVEGETIDEKPVEPDFPIIEKIQILESKMESLQQENKLLLERAKKAEETNAVNQEIMLALAKAILLLKQEENEENKVNILDAIVKLLTMILEGLLTDGPVGDDKKAKSESNDKKTKSSPKNPEIAKLLHELRLRGGNNLPLEDDKALSQQPQAVAA